MKSYIYDLDENKFYTENGKEKIEREEFIASGKEFELDVMASQLEGFKEKVEVLRQKYPKAEIKIDLRFIREYIYEQNEMKQLEDIDKFCASQNIKLYIRLGEFVGGEYQNILMARNQIEELKQKINSFTYEENGKQVNLSPYEKFLIIYKFVANRVYNQSENCNDNRMRNWIGVLTSDKVICSGFASLLKCVCDQVFTAEELKCYKQGSSVYDEKAELLGGHANNLVIINDPKYNLNGLYYADACWDCKDEINNKTTFNYCLIPIQQIVEHKKCNFAFDKNLVVYQDINPYYSQESGEYRFHPLMEDIVAKYGFKTEQELIEDANIDETVEKKKQTHEQRQEQIRNSNEKLRQEIDTKVQEFFTKIGFENLEEFKVMPYYPATLEEKDPEIAGILNFFENIQSLENLDNAEIIEKAQYYKEIYYKNAERLKQINSKSLLRAKELGLGYNEKTIIECVKSEIFYNNMQEEHLFRENYEKAKMQEEIKTQHQQDIQECLRIGQDFIYSQPIDDKKFAKGLVAMARYVGYDESKIKDWAKAEVDKRKEFTLNTFCGKEVVLPQKEKEEDMFNF